MANSATSKTAYGKCGCGKTVRFPEDKLTVFCGCGREAQRPRKRRKAPDVVLPRP